MLTYGVSTDVAIGLLSIIDSCTRRDESVAGFATPNGNGDIVVGATRMVDGT
jgi:hypothetical protein